MCGIIGCISKEAVNTGHLQSMRDTMIHRGPDQAGFFAGADGRGWLGHRRLSIIDLSEAGRQPLCDSEKQLWLVFNGEIYNFLELREVLEKQGYSFVTRTDSEVIVYAYKRWGTQCLQYFNGMFAFGIYDSLKHKLFLARDRVGKKPLYYGSYRGKFVFASELKAFTADPEFDRRLNPAALNLYFALGYVPGNQCIYEGVCKLLPGHYLVYDIKSREVKVTKYWNLEDLIDHSEVSNDEDAVTEELDELLSDATKIRMLSDVPLGVFLSGGIDSSLVTGYMAKHSSVAVKTYTIGFREKRFNEMEFARIVASSFHTDHHERIVTQDALEVLPLISRQMDEPVSDQSLIPTYYVCREGKRDITVALSGDGGDELFLGYDWYRRLPLAPIYQNMPVVLKKCGSWLGRRLPSETIGKGFLSGLNNDFLSETIDKRLVFKLLEREKLFSFDVKSLLGARINEPESLLMHIMSSLPGDLKLKFSYLDFLTYLVDDILVKVDRMSMLCSLEVRSPFLDYRVVEFLYSRISSRLKMRGFQRKYLLKRIARRQLPSKLPLNRKQGFAIPLNQWMRDELREYTKEQLLALDNNLFSRKHIERLFSDHQTGINYGTQIFACLMFSLWNQRYG